MNNTQVIFHPINFTRAAALCLVLIILTVSSVLAGEIFGTIKADGKVVPKGLKVEITTPDTSYSAVTDNYGSYRLFVPQKGKCSLTVHYRQKAPSIQIYSYPKSTRYDFIIEQKDTVFALKRK